MGVAAAGSDKPAILLAGAAGLVAGAMSMAAGEYVSVSSQSDTEKADLDIERRELANDLATALMNRGIALRNLGRLDEAVAACVRCKADHIAEGYEASGVSEKEAERRAWEERLRDTIAVRGVPPKFEGRVVPLDVLRILKLDEAERDEAERVRMQRHYAALAPALEPLRKAQAEAAGRLNEFQPIRTPVLRELPAGERRATHIFERGNHLTPGDEVEPGVPASMPNTPMFVMEMVPPESSAGLVLPARAASVRAVIAVDSSVTDIASCFRSKSSIARSEATGSEIFIRNWEHLSNDRVKSFSNAGLGDAWYSLYLETPPAPKQQRMGGYGRNPRGF